VHLLSISQSLLEILKKRLQLILGVDSRFTRRLLDRAYLEVFGEQVPDKILQRIQAADTLAQPLKLNTECLDFRIVATQVVASKSKLVDTRGIEFVKMVLHSLDLRFVIRDLTAGSRHFRGLQSAKICDSLAEVAEVRLDHFDLLSCVLEFTNF